MTVIRPPATLQDCTVPWLEAALREAGLLSPEHALSSLRLETIGEGQGLMGSLARVHLEGAPRELGDTLVVKLPASDRQNRGQGELLGLYEREILFYRELASRVAIAVPRCLFAALDPAPWSGSPNDSRARARVERLPDWLFRWVVRLAGWAGGRSKRRYVLLLEDLAPRTPGDQVAIPPEPQLRSAVETAARLHAGFWGDDTIASLGWLPPLSESPRVARILFESARPILERDHGDTVPAALLTLAERVVGRSAYLSEKLATPPWTLLHGDFRLDNLFFDPEGSEPPIVADWQIPTRGRGPYDLAYLLCGSLGPETSADQEMAWVREYHQTLCSAGVREYELESCVADYQRAMLQMLPRIFSALANVDFHNDRGRSLATLWCERLIGRIEAHDSARWEEPLE